MTDFLLQMSGKTESGLFVLAAAVVSGKRRQTNVSVHIKRRV